MSLLHSDTEKAPFLSPARHFRLSLSHPDPAVEIDSDNMSLEDVDDASSADGDSTEPRNAKQNLSLLAAERKRADLAQAQEWRRDFEKRTNDYNAETDAASLISTGATGADKRIISSPREYQVELFERAKEKNIIAVLDTGSGKTLIAALLLRHTIEQELIEQDVGSAPRVSFFLVDTVALASQQCRVLQANLDYPVAMFHGEFVGRASTADFWKEQLEKNMIIVCTAAILHQCLHYSFVKLDQINLIIFDEAHHAKKNHPYARIIKDFYADLEKKGQRRPKIFGMTASPIDAKTDLIIATAQLEGLLHSEIATADPAVMQGSFGPDEKYEENVEYSLVSVAFETGLWQRLHHLVGSNEEFRKLFIFSKAATRDLGRWCADRMWHLSLTSEETNKIKARTERTLISGPMEQSVAVIDAATAAVLSAHDLVADHVLPELQLALEHVSHKVLVLVDMLQKNFDSSKDKCIIFVEQRLTAVLLTDLLKQLGMKIKGIKPGALVGSGTGDAGDHLCMTYKHQLGTLDRFRDEDDLNCLVATSIAEEGLDVPDCNMIIRFDLYNTMIQYIQSKGRARQKGSKYFHMVELGNLEHAGRVFDNRRNEERLRKFCQSLPEDRRLTGLDFNMEYFLWREKGKRKYTVPSTNAKLTYRMSLIVLANFVASLPRSSDFVPQADFVVKSVGKEFQCEVILPDSSPVKSARGRREGSKQMAKCSAAFDVCLRLLKAGAIDQHLRPKYTDRLPAMRNARLALSSKKRAEYPMKTKPDIWSNRGLPDKLYITVVKLASPGAMDRSSRPLAILTRTRLPQVARFPIFFGNKHTSIVECMPFSTHLTVAGDDVTQLAEFTLRIFRDVFSKEYKPELEMLPYYLAPLVNEHQFDFASTTLLRDLIDWDFLGQLRSTGDLMWEDEPDHIFSNKFVIDPHDGSRKFYTISRRHDLKPTDPQLPTAPKGAVNAKAWTESPKDIWNYSISLWSKSRAKLQVQDDLPVVEAEYIPLRRNLLDEFERPDAENKRCYLTFATLKLSALPVDIVAMAYSLPAIMHRLDSNLIVLEACHRLGLDIRADIALEAMTKDSDNTDEHAEQQINFQRGMGSNYERLEFLGDSFLKMSTTVSLFTKDPEKDEFNYHVDRMVLICNKNLFNNALDLKLEESIRSKSFNRRIWYPDGLELLRGKQNTSIAGRKGAGRGVHILADKSVADVCEALIGAAYLTTYKQKSFDLAVQAVTKFVNHDNHKAMTWDEFFTRYKTPDWLTAQPTAVHLHLAKQVQSLGYTFTQARLLRSAFTHPTYSFMYEHIPNYQRLEFLGDALYDMVCVDYLFHRFPKADPQWLTEHKMAMVSNQFLGCLCVSLGLHTHMISMDSALPGQITAYVTAITRAREEAEQEAVAAGRPTGSYARNFWINIMEPPKCLPDITESFIGAMFVDSQYDYSTVQRFFDVHVCPWFEDMHVYDTFANKHPVTHLHLKLAMQLKCARYRLILQEVSIDNASLTETQIACVVMIHGQVRVHATAASGRYAKTAAAKKMLVELEDMSIDEFKGKFGCNCTAEDVEHADPMASGTAL